jgi:hypothetical protein
MKIAVSIPDGLFHAAEQLAARWGISRSQLYAKALDALVDKHSDGAITSRLNEIYGPKGQDTSLDPALAAIQRSMLKKNS